MELNPGGIIAWIVVGLIAALLGGFLVGSFFRAAPEWACLGASWSPSSVL